MSKSPRRDPRRRTGSSSRRYTPSDLVRMERRSEISKEGIVAGIAVSIVAAMMIALIWVAAERSIDETRQVVREQAEQHLAAEAAVLEYEKVILLRPSAESYVMLARAYRADGFPKPITPAPSVAPSNE